MLLLHHRTQAQGFVLPLAMGASLVLVLAALSAHTTSLQIRLQGVREQQQRQMEDRLASAGHMVLADLNQNQPCLLGVPLERWNDLGLACASPGTLQSLREGQVLGSSYRLIGWSPDVQPAELLLELADAGGQPPRRGAFSVRLTPPQPPSQPHPQASDVRLLGLRGLEP